MNKALGNGGLFFVVATASRNWWVCEMEKHPLWGNVEKCSKDVDSRIYAFFANRLIMGLRNSDMYECV